MTNSPLPPTIGRRGFLAGATALTAAPVLTGAWSPASALVLPSVTPVWSETVRRSFGVAVHPNARRTVYGKVDAWTQLAGNLGAGYIRGKYAPHLRETQQTVARCRTFGLKWLMTLIPENWSMSHAELKASLAHIRDHAADVCAGIEGMNEPEHNRDGSPVRSDWAAATVAYQRIIKEFVRATPALSHVTVVGPSLQMGGSNPLEDMYALTRAGVAPYMDYAGLHSYPAGFRPETNVDKRLSWVAQAWTGKPTWVSETGYNNAMNAPLGGPRPTPTDVSATYGPRSVLEYFTRGCKAVRYELLDDPNAGANVAESNYGMVECPGLDPTKWTVKPEYTTMQRFLGSLRDSARSYTPAPVALQVAAPSTVKWLAVGKSDGSHTVLAYQNTSLYDPIKRIKLLTVGPVDVTVTDRFGPRVVPVGPAVKAIPLR